jgi:hypothetical protein
VPVQSPPQFTCRADQASGSRRFVALVARLELTLRIVPIVGTPARRGKVCFRTLSLKTSREIISVTRSPPAAAAGT